MSRVVWLQRKQHKRVGIPHLKGLSTSHVDSKFCPEGDAKFCKVGTPRGLVNPLNQLLDPSVPASCDVLLVKMRDGSDISHVINFINFGGHLVAQK